MTTEEFPFLTINGWHRAANVAAEGNAVRIVRCTHGAAVNGGDGSVEVRIEMLDINMRGDHQDLSEK